MKPPARALSIKEKLSLLAEVIGDGDAQLRKLRHLRATLALYRSPEELQRRLSRLCELGYAAHVPTRAQVLFGGLDMLRFLIEPGAREARMSLGFQRLLWTLADPAAWLDPGGLTSERDAIVEHLLSMLHENARYDLQLLQMFPDGWDALERALQALVSGTHPRSQQLRASAKDPLYHEQLLDYLQRLRRDPHAAPPRRARETPDNDGALNAAVAAFAELRGYLAYCAALPRDLSGLVARYRAFNRFSDVVAVHGDLNASMPAR